MANPIESTLTAAQRASLEIVDFIFHIIELEDGREEKMVFLDEVSLTKKQRTFFVERLRDILEGTQYSYLPNAVFMKEKCEQIATQKPEFNELSRQIAGKFASMHGSRMSEGLVVVSVVRFQASANDWKNLVLLVKLDKGASISYSRKEVGGRQIAVMEEVPNSLADSKAAVQKSAVINAEGYFAWDVLAYDKRFQPRLAEYFKAFLEVTERQQDSVLTRMAHDAVRKWAKRIDKESFPENEDAATYIGRSMNYLKDRDKFDTDEYIATVVRDENAERKKKFTHELHTALASAGVAGQQFTPRPGSLKPAERKQKYVTHEGVTIIFEGSKEAVNLQTIEGKDGQTTITIKTKSLTLQ